MEKEVPVSHFEGAEGQELGRGPGFRDVEVEVLLCGQQRERLDLHVVVGAVQFHLEDIAWKQVSVGIRGGSIFSFSKQIDLAGCFSNSI